MSKDSKERIQYISACVMLGSGILLTFLCFFLNHYKIEDSVLWYVAQSLVYAGSVFGITMYISTTRREITNFLNDRLGGGKEDRLAKEEPHEQERYERHRSAPCGPSFPSLRGGVRVADA